MPSSPDPKCPAGCEAYSSSAQLGKRLLCSQVHAARLVKAGELVPVGNSISRTFYRTADLDVLRARMFAAIREKALALNCDERQAMRAMFAQALALEAGRENANDADRAEGAMIGDEEFVEAACSDIRKKLAELEARLKGRTNS